MTIRTILAVLTALSGCHSYHLQVMNPPQDCSTDPNKNYFNLECYEKSINIYFEEHTLHITHNDGLFVIDLTTFPKLIISEELRGGTQKLHGIRIENCTMTDDTSFGTLFEHFGITDEILAFEGINILPPGMPLDGRFSTGFEKLEKLTLYRNSISQLNEHVFRSLKNLSYLDLTHNEIEVLDKNVFQNLTELSILKLGDNQLRSLSEGMFDHQKKLDILLLHRNRLQNLNKEMFRGLDSLRVLFLQKNYLPNLMDDVFHNLPKLQHISMGRDNMELPYAIFANHSSLKVVSLEKVKIAKGLHLSGLNKIEIKSSEVLTISGLSNIKTVIIIYCTLPPLTVTSFENLSSMKVLNISSNKINNLPDGLFDNLTELAVLKISKNLLTNISGLVFRDLRNVIEIDLSDNHLTTIDPNAFVTTTHLTTLNLKNNQLSFRDYKMPFMFLNNLKYLNLSKNNLTRMPTDLEKLGELEEVDLSFNQISSVTFSDIRQIVKLNSTYETRPTFGSGNTRTYLNNNLLNCDCNMFDFLKGTDYEQLAPVFSDKCDKQTCPRETYLSDQCPTGCACEKRSDKSGLHILISCKGKHLTRLPKIEFINATSIELDISKNSLQELPLLYSNLPVTFIQASFNRISKIDIRNLPTTLRGLDLSHNNIRTIAADVILYMRNHKTLEIFLLKNNPLECHCSSEDTAQFIKFVNENSSMMDLQGAKCNKYYELSMEVIQKDCKKNLIMYILIVVTILMLISGVILILLVKHSKLIKMWLYAHDWFLWWVDEEYVDRDMVYDIFISYAHENRKLAIRIMYALEKCNIFKVCLHERNFLGGERIEESVRNAVRTSRRTLVILSEDYLNSVWCEHEFHLAWERSVAEKRKLIIAVKDGHLGTITDETIQSYIKTHTYIESGDQWFWERLVFRLPHKKMIKKIFPIREFEFLMEEELAM